MKFSRRKNKEKSKFILKFLIAFLILIGVSAIRSISTKTPINQSICPGILCNRG